jgi:cytochrome c6
MKFASITFFKALVLTVSIALALFILNGELQTYSARAANFEPAAFADGAEIYARSCTRCHGADGRGQTPKGKQTGAPDFTGKKWKPNDARMIEVITNGKGKMPKFKGTLDEDEIKAVMMYVKTLKK